MSAATRRWQLHGQLATQLLGDCFLRSASFCVVIKADLVHRRLKHITAATVNSGLRSQLQCYNYDINPMLCTLAAACSPHQNWQEASRVTAAHHCNTNNASQVSAPRLIMVLDGSTKVLSSCKQHCYHWQVLIPRVSFWSRQTHQCPDGMCDACMYRSPRHKMWKSQAIIHTNLASQQTNQDLKRTNLCKPANQPRPKENPVRTARPTFTLSYTASSARAVHLVATTPPLVTAGRSTATSLSSMLLTTSRCCIASSRPPLGLAAVAGVARWGAAAAPVVVSSRSSSSLFLYSAHTPAKQGITGTP